MLLKQFLNEQNRLQAVEGSFAIKELSDKKWADWVEQHCSNYLSRADRYPIYHGFYKKVTSKLGIKDTNEFTRRQEGPGLGSYHVLWVDNANQWRNYPKRSKSFIYSNSNFRRAHSSHLHNTYQLFPADNAKIGICPTDNFLFSFDNLPDDNMVDFNDRIANAFIQIYGYDTAERAQFNWSEFKRLLEITDFDKFLRINKEFVDEFERNVQKKYPKLIDFFEEEIVPEKHGFEHATPTTYSVTYNDEKEVWVQGEVALLDVFSVFGNDGHRFPKTTALLSKYNIKAPHHLHKVHRIK